MNPALDAAERAATYAGIGLVVTTVGVLVTATVGWFMYRAARRGPLKGPEWSVEGVGSGRRGCELRNGEGAAEATNVRLVSLDDSRIDGPVQWDRFSPGQREVFFPARKWGSPSDHRVRVTWTPTHRRDPGTWESALPWAD